MSSFPRRNPSPARNGIAAGLDSLSRGAHAPAVTFDAARRMMADITAAEDVIDPHAAPLVKLGPGGDFTREYNPREVGREVFGPEFAKGSSNRKADQIRAACDGLLAGYATMQAAFSELRRLCRTTTALDQASEGFDKLEDGLIVLAETISDAADAHTQKGPACTCPLCGAGTQAADQDPDPFGRLKMAPARVECVSCEWMATEDELAGGGQ